MANIPKKEFIEMISMKVNMRNSDVKETVQEFLDLLQAELAKGNRFEFRGFGSFEVVIRKERKALNPRTMQTVIIPQRAVVQFRPGKAFRDKINEAYSNGKLDDV